jgi:hypothetical protein
MMSEEQDGRLSYQQAVTEAIQRRQASFAAMPVFGERTDDAEQTAEGARIFIVEPDGEGDWQLRFIAGPFFSNAYAANEILTPEEVPASIRELRFMPTRIDESWFSEQVQILIQKLVQGSGIDVQMPDYQGMPSRSADEEVVFPVNFIGRPGDAQPH